MDVGQFVAAGTQLAVTFAVDFAEIRLPLPDRELPYLDLPESFTEGQQTPGIHVDLTAELGGTFYHWEGNIVRTEGVFDQRSRVLYVVVQVADPYNRLHQRWQTPLRIGTFVEASIEGRLFEEVIVLPRGVLRADNVVWTVGENNVLTPNTVSLLRADEDFIYVKSGLEEASLVCKTTLDNPLPGTRVRYDQVVEN